MYTYIQDIANDRSNSRDRIQFFSQNQICNLQICHGKKKKNCTKRCKKEKKEFVKKKIYIYVYRSKYTARACVNQYTILYMKKRYIIQI